VSTVSRFLLQAWKAPVQVVAINDWRVSVATFFLFSPPVLHAAALCFCRSAICRTRLLQSILSVLDLLCYYLRILSLRQRRVVICGCPVAASGCMPSIAITQYKIETVQGARVLQEDRRV